VSKTVIKIQLNRWEWEIVEFLAKERNKISQVGGYYRIPGNREDPLNVARRGVAAEIGFAKMANLFPITNQDGSQAGKPDYIINRKTVDVKGTDGLTNDLMVSTDAKHRWQIYPVMAVIRPFVYYLGYSYGDVLFQDRRIKVPQALNGIPRTPFYRVLNCELLTNPFWIESKTQDQSDRWCQLNFLNPEEI
jgi:hypothetical protein